MPRNRDRKPFDRFQTFRLLVNLNSRESSTIVDRITGRTGPRIRPERLPRNLAAEVRVCFCRRYDRVSASRVRPVVQSRKLLRGAGLGSSWVVEFASGDGTPPAGHSRRRDAASSSRWWRSLRLMYTESRSRGLAPGRQWHFGQLSDKLESFARTLIKFHGTPRKPARHVPRSIKTSRSLFDVLRVPARINRTGSRSSPRSRVVVSWSCESR